MGSPADPGTPEGTQGSLEARIARLEEQVARLCRLVEQPGPQPVPVAEQRAIPAAPPPLPAPLADHVSVAARSSGAGTRERESTFEARLGSQWFNRIGIVLLLLGTSWFLKLAIDRGWIVPSPLVRVVFGLLAGAGLVLWSERFRRRGFAPFSYSLKAVGAGVLYLSLWAGFRLYGLLPAAVALVLMIAVTGWNAFMAWAQDAELLAVYALAGGLATPLLLSTGGNHEVFLFTYLLAIDVATVLLVRVKRWPRLLLGAFPATVAFFVGWYFEWWQAPELSVTCVFLLLFWATFACVPLRSDGHDEPGRSPLIEEILLPTANAAFAVLAFYSMLQDSGNHALIAWMVVLYGAVYLGWMRLPQSRTARAIHLSIAVVLLTIAIPLKVSGHWITAGWLVEGLALTWVTRETAGGDNTAATVLRWLTVGALILGVGMTLFDLFPLTPAGAPLWNSDIGTALLALAMLAGVAALALRAAGQLGDGFWEQLGAAAVILFNLVAVLTGVREVAAIWPAISVGDTDAALKQGFAISGFLMLYGAALLAVGFQRRSAFLRWQGLALLVFTIFKTFLYDIRDLSQGYRVASFLTLGALLMAVSYAYQRDWLGLRPAAEAGHDSSSHEAHE